MNGPRFRGAGAVRAPVREPDREALLWLGFVERPVAARGERRVPELDELRDRDDVGVLVPMVGEPNSDTA